MPRDKRDIALLEAREHQVRALKEKIERLESEIERLKSLVDPERLEREKKYSGE